MAWTKPGTKTAKATNQDMRATFYYSDDSAAPPNSLRFLLLIETDDGSESGDVLVDDALTPTEKTDLLAALVKLRDAALVEAGYTNS